jgi:hypothetical protein
VLEAGRHGLLAMPRSDTISIFSSRGLVIDAAIRADGQLKRGTRDILACIWTTGKSALSLVDGSCSPTYSAIWKRSLGNWEMYFHPLWKHVPW